jgi:hypothetical protein
MSSSKQKQKSIQAQDRRLEHRSPISYTAFSGLYPIAPRLRTRLRYTDTFTVTTSAGPGIGNAVFNLNGLFDPDSTGAGHQPMGFDQLASLYNRYRVYKTWWTVRVLPVASTATPYHLAIVPTNSTTVFTNFSTAAEQTYSKTSIFNSYTIAEHTGSIEIAKLNGKTPEAYMSDDTTQAQVTANPSEAFGLHCLVYEPAGTGVGFRYEINLIFDCEFSDPIPLAQS